jgi:hypothetical protein
MTHFHATNVRERSEHRFRVSPAAEAAYGGASVALGGQPLKLATANASNVSVVALSTRKLLLLRDGAVVQTIDTPDYDVTVLTFSPNDAQLAVGCSDNAVRFFAVGAQLTPEGEIKQHSNPVGAIAYSADGSIPPFYQRSAFTASFTISSN